jgi:hypothetical protein
VHERDRSAAQVADAERVGAAAGNRVDLLDAAQVGHARVDVARDPQPAAVRREGHELGHVGGAERADEITVAAPVDDELVGRVGGLYLDEGEGADHEQGLREAGGGDLLLLVRAVNRQSSELSEPASVAAS